MLHGVEVDDRDGVTMLKVDSIGTQLGLGGIFNREIYVNKLYLKGARMVLYKKTPKSAPNYQFVLDAFKKKSKQKKMLKSLQPQIFRRDYLMQLEGKYKGGTLRTHAGGVWLDGYSDHLPTLVYLVKEQK